MIVEDFRERPTRDAGRDGMTILLVGKPIGTLDFFFAGSDDRTRTNKEMRQEEKQWIYSKIFVEHELLID